MVHNSNIREYFSQFSIPVTRPHDQIFSAFLIKTFELHEIGQEKYVLKML